MTDTAIDDTETTISQTTRIVAAYVSKNPVAAGDLPKLISDTFSAVKALQIVPEAEKPVEKPVPAVPVRKSVTDDHIICLEDGRKFKTLKRHLSTKYNMTPDEYRSKWGLPADYPMIAPNYSQRRSALAKTIGLGQKTVTRRKAS